MHQAVEEGNLGKIKKVKKIYIIWFCLLMSKEFVLKNVVASTGLTKRDEVAEYIITYV